MKAAAWCMFIVSIVCFGIGFRAQQLDRQCQDISVRPPVPTEEFVRISQHLSAEAEMSPPTTEPFGGDVAAADVASADAR